MPSTYEPIATYTTTGATATYTFSSIPQTYTDLVLVSNVKVSSNQEALQVQFNSDTGSNYSFTQLGGDGSATYTYRAANTTSIYATNGTSASQFGTGVFNILDYANTARHKSILARFSEPDYTAWQNIGLWRNANAITSITLSVSGTSKTISTGSTFTLFGIKAA